ncbi:MAG: hypothetical protein KGY60_10220 [Bacteroidales bacterium]|nr:hypothetical protein [Bacteroidales bacterium]
MKYALLGLMLAIIFTAGCQNNQKPEKKPIAKIHDQYLYLSDLKSVVPDNKPKQDSTMIAKNYIQDWIKRQLLLNKAEENLDPQSKDIRKQIENYRASLLIYRYQQQLIDQKLDTAVSQQEIASYYNENTSNFVLDKNLARVLYIKLAENSPNMGRVRQWYKSDDEQDRTRLKDYCYQYAEKFDNFNNRWIDFNGLIKNIPYEMDRPERFFRNRRFLEVKDNSFYHFIRINDYKLKGSTAPMDYVEDRIKSIIINKRKHQLLEKLENDIYNEALNHNEFVIY